MSLNDTKDYRMQETISLVERYLPLNKWNFKQASRFFDNNIHPIVIYRSEKCKFKVSMMAPDGYGMDSSIAIHYGRLEVGDIAHTLLGRAQVDKYSHFWHSVRGPLYFLDGLSPQEAQNAKHPRFIREFEQSDVAKAIKYEPEQNVIEHAKIWEIYGQQLFDIFDRSNKKLWKQYCIFEKEFWETLPQI